MFKVKRDESGVVVSKSGELALALFIRKRVLTATAVALSATLLAACETATPIAASPAIQAGANAPADRILARGWQLPAEDGAVSARRVNRKGQHQIRAIDPTVIAAALAIEVRALPILVAQKSGIAGSTTTAATDPVIETADVRVPAVRK